MGFDYGKLTFFLVGLVTALILLLVYLGVLVKRVEKKDAE